MKNPFLNKTRIQNYHQAHQLSPEARIRELYAIEQFVGKERVGNILEIGSGSGYLTNWLLDHGDVVDTVDIVEQKLQGVRKHFVMDLKDRLPKQLLSNSYDLIISLATFHHIANDPNTLPPALINDLIRVMKPGGKLVIVDVPSGNDQFKFNNNQIRLAYQLTSHFFREIVDIYSQHQPVYIH